MATDVAFYADRLAQKEHELIELQATFNRYKLKNKVKYDQLRKEVNAYCSEHGYSINEKENNALLLIRLAETEAALDATSREAECLRKEMSKKQTQLNDQLILIKNMEEQIRASQPLSPVEIQERKRAAQMIDIDRIQQQMLFKDERIVELNNVILDKERQILDLQELCREQGEVASVTSQAARIVQRQWEERNREHREVGTETDNSLWTPPRASQRNGEPRVRGESPGRAVANRGTANTSPPPLDPSEALERSGRREDDEDLPGTSISFLGRGQEIDFSLRKKNRKRVTFDLLSTAQAQQSSIRSDEHFTQMVLELSGENERLRRELLDTTTNLNRLQSKVDKADADMTKVVRDGRAQALKARAVAQARIKELEDHMAQLDTQHADQVERLQTEIESLRSTREWEVEQNAQLREQLNQAKIKNHKLTEELDASEKTNRDWEIKVAHGEEFLDQLIEDLAEAEDCINYMERQKHDILDDVDKLKDAIIAQDQLIEILEADIVIYEEHIGILRESLGASKVDHRALLRSKAFETKLKALEREKEQINRKSNEDRLRTKALDQKCKVLEEQNEKLVAKVCEFEMRERDEADMAETCKQLEKRLREAEEREQVYRTECELRLEKARLEAERKSDEAARLLEELHETQLKVTRRSVSLERRREASSESSSQTGQTEINVEREHLRARAAEQDVELVRLRDEVEQVSALREELEQVRAKCSETAEELDRMHCMNFELKTKADTLAANLKAKEEESQSLRILYDRTSDELARQQHEEQSRRDEEKQLQAELDSVRQQLNASEDGKQSLEQEVESLKTSLADAKASLASHRVDMGEFQEKIDRLEGELFAARSELDNARLGLQETNAVKKELEQLKEELEHEKSSGRAKWEEVCKKMLEGEASSPQSRKDSLEVINKVQHVEYMTAFEEKITALEKELQEAKARIEQDKAEKKKLKQALKVFRDKEKANSEPPGGLPTVTEVQEPIIVRESIQTLAAAPSNLSEENMQKLRDKIQELELENRLSRELNTEYNHTMLEMEKEVIALKAKVTSLQGETEHFEMELKLHEMLEEELEKELAEARQKNQELTEAVHGHEETLEHLNERVNDDSATTEQHLKELMDELNKIREKNKVLNEELALASQQAATSRITLEQEKSAVVEIKKAHSEEVKILSSSLEDAQRHISDVEERLLQTESSLSDSRSIIEELKRAVKEKNRKLEELQKELLEYGKEETVQQTALLRAANTTSEVVASVLVGETEFVSFNANQAEVTATLESKESAPTTAAVEITVSEPNSGNEGVILQGTPLPSPAPATDLFAENLILRQCVNESNQMQKDLTEDVEKMWQLKTELENAVEALKGEIWSLNGQLKASILDREQLQDRVVQLDSSLAAEKKRADALDCELSEQTELTEKASRQAAEAENESNRRLAECLEMETRREQVEKAYAQLSEYYSQLQAAYNMIYAKMTELEKERTLVQNQSQQAPPSSTIMEGDSHINAIASVIDTMISELQTEIPEGTDLHGKVLLIQKTLREKLAELEEHRQAIAEHRRANEELHQQLQSLEEETQKAGGENRDAKARLLQLEGDLEWKQDECDSLRRRVDELQATIDQLVERNQENDTLAASRLRIELAILAAKLATRQADVDSLFRANAELAHTNVRLQNEIDELEERDNSCKDEEQQMQQVEQLQAELSRSRSAEASLRQQLEELRSRLSEAESKLDEYAARFSEQAQQEEAAATQLEEQRVRKEVIATEFLPANAEASSVQEGSTDGVADLHEEVIRLQSVEKMLNERIMCLEDQLLEGEERLQETEEELIDEKKKVEALETDKNALTKELEQFLSASQNGESNQNRPWGWDEEGPASNEADLQKQLEKSRVELANCQKELEELRKEKQEAPSHALFETELMHLRSELEQTKKELQEQKQITGAATASMSERTSYILEIENMEHELDRVRQELETAQLLLKQKEESVRLGEKTSTLEVGWGWDEPQAHDTKAAEIPSLEAGVAEEKERQYRKTIEELETKIELLNEELASAEACREELEDASHQVNELQHELRELKKQAQEHVSEKEQLMQKIADLEKNKDSSWGDDWDDSDNSISKMDEEKQELERSRDEANQKVAELEFQLQKKMFALVESEKEFALLKEKVSRLEAEKVQADLQMTAEEDGWGNGWKASEQTTELAAEVRRREEAETLVENLRNVSATLRVQVDDLQDKLLSETEKTEARQAEVRKLEAKVEQLQTTLAARAEIQEAEHYRSENEMETLCEEQRRVEDELSSFEAEKIRLEEQLMASKMMCDDLKTELQLQKANSSELTVKYEEVRRRCEELEATLLAVEAERDSLSERLAMVKSELESLMKQIESKEEQDKKADDYSLEELQKLRVQKERLEADMAEMKRTLEEKEVQNNLLKDSEARLLDSVDEYGEQAEKYQLETERLQKVVNSLEKKKNELEEQVEELRKSEKTHEEQQHEAEEKLRVMEKEREKLEAKISQQSTSKAASIDSSELSVIKNQLDSMTAERNELLTRLEKTESRLNASIQEKLTISRSYEQLRARLVARRQAMTSSRESSRRSSTVTPEIEVPEEPRRSEEPALSIQGTYFPHQTSSALKNQSYREVISEFLMEIENFLETEEERHVVVHEIIEALDPINRGSSVEMAKEPATEDAALEAIASDAGDMAQEDGVADDPEDDSEKLRQQVSLLRKQSSCLVEEFSMKMKALEQENSKLKESLQNSRASSKDTVPITVTSGAPTENGEHRSLEEVLAELKTKSNELEEIRGSHSDALNYIVSLKSEISDLNEKLSDRDRIIEEAKEHLKLLEQTSEELSNTCKEVDGNAFDVNSENHSDEEIAKMVVESTTTERLGTSESCRRTVDIATSPSTTQVETSIQTEIDVEELLRAKETMEHLLNSERKKHDELMSSLHILAEQEGCDKNILMEKYSELKAKYDDVTAELEQSRSAYTSALVELTSIQNENDELARARKELLEKVNQLEQENLAVTEDSIAKEHEVAELKEKNNDLVEKFRNCTWKIKSLEEAESKRTAEYEELTKRFDSERSKMNLEKEELLEKLEDSTHKLNFMEVDQEEKRQFCEDLVRRCNEFEEKLEDERIKYDESVEMIKSEMETLRYGYGSTLDSLQKANLKIDELENLLLSKTKEHQVANDQTEVLTQRIAELEETAKSAEEDLEATRSAFANQVGENHRLKAELALLNQNQHREIEEESSELQKRLDVAELELVRSRERVEHLESEVNDHVHRNQKLQAQVSSMSEQLSGLEAAVREGESALADARAQSSVEINELKGQLTKSNATVDTLLAQLEVAFGNVPVEKVEKQLMDAQMSANNTKCNLEKLVGEREELAKRVKDVEEKLSITEQELTSARVKCETVDEEKQRLCVELEAVRKSEDSISHELWTLREEQITHDARQKEMAAKNTRLSAEIDSLRKKISALEAREGSLVAEMSALHEEKKAWTEKEVELGIVVTNRDEMERKLKSLQQTYEELQKRLEASELESQRVKAYCSEVEKDLAEKIKHAKEMDELREILLLKEEEIESLKGKVRLFEEEQLIADVKSANLKEEVEALTNSLVDRDESLARCETEIASLHMELAEHRERVTVTHVQSSVELKRSEETINHLRDDNVRLERELFIAHEQLESTRSELGAVRQSLEHSEALALATRNENQRLVEEVGRAVFEREQTFAMAGEGKEAAARVLALERSIAQLKAEHDEKMEQVLGDLEASEQRVRTLTDAAEQARLQSVESTRKMESYRERFELAIQEIESLTRANEEVRHLESALEQNRSEKAKLYENLTNLQSYVDRVVAEKDALLAQLASLNGQLDERTNRLRQAGEAKMDTTLRIVELESQIAALLRERDKADEHSLDTPSSSGMNLSAPTEHVAVQIEPEGDRQSAEMNQLRIDLQRAEQRIAELEIFEQMVGDTAVLLNNTEPSQSDHSETVDSSRFVSASTPFPSLVTLLSRRISALRRRPQRALLPYFRYALAGYIVLIHMMVIHSWFFANCL